MEGIVLEIQGHVKEANPEIYDGLEWAETETDEVTPDDVKNKFGDQRVMHSTMIFHRLITILSRVSIGDTSDCAAGVRTRGLEAFLHKRKMRVTPVDAARDEPREDPQGPRRADFHEQVAGPGKRDGARPLGSRHRPDEDRNSHSDDASRAS